MCGTPSRSLKPRFERGEDAIDRGFRRVDRAGEVGQADAGGRVFDVFENIQGLENQHSAGFGRSDLYHIVIQTDKTPTVDTRG
jgi:hypothetical protein